MICPKMFKLLVNDLFADIQKFSWMVSDENTNECIFEFVHANHTAPNDICQRLMDIYEEETIDVRTVRL